MQLNKCVRSQREHVWAGWQRTGCAAAMTCAALVSGAQAKAPPRAVAPPYSAPDPLSAQPMQWATDAANNELTVVQYHGAYLRYHMHTLDRKGDQVRDVIESKDGAVARLIYKEHRPLTHEEDTAEHERLQAMLDSPSAFERHIRSDADGKKMAVDMIKLMPAAMLFNYTAGQPQRDRPGTRPDNPPEVVLDFTPNPKWTPPNMTSQALTGLRGRLWIDQRTHYMTRMEAEVFQGVNFGFGMLAHIYPGGQLSCDQSKVSDQRWLFTRFIQHVTVRAMMLKTIKEESNVHAFEVSPINAMNYQDAIRALESTPLPTHLDVPD